MAAISEQTLEKLALTCFADLGYGFVHKPGIAPVGLPLSGEVGVACTETGVAHELS